jgi:hypothetical protein
LQGPRLVVALLPERCAAAPDGQFSSFVLGRRDAVPPQPGSFLGSLLSLEEAAEISGLIRPTLTAQRLGFSDVTVGRSILVAFEADGCTTMAAAIQERNLHAF